MKTTIDADPAVIRVSSSKYFVRKGESSYEFTDTGLLRFNVSVMTPGFMEEQCYYPAQSLNFQLEPVEAEKLVEALRQPTASRRSVDQGTVLVYKYSKDHGCWYDQFRNTPTTDLTLYSKPIVEEGDGT